MSGECDEPTLYLHRRHLPAEIPDRVYLGPVHIMRGEMLQQIVTRADPQLIFEQFRTRRTDPFYVFNLYVTRCYQTFAIFDVLLNDVVVHPLTRFSFPQNQFR